MTDSLILDMFEVNKEVNKLPYRSDIQLYKTAEFWTQIKGEGGDCEDYALRKRQLLIERGHDASRLRIAVCRLKNGTGHAVLTVDTVSGTYVLDNNTNEIYPWNNPPYPIHWVARQSSELGKWVLIDDIAWRGL